MQFATDVRFKLKSSNIYSIVYYQELTFTIMEEQIGSKNSYSITNLPQPEQVKRLHHLFENKILDSFVSECRTMLEIGANLSELSSKYTLNYDLLVQYEEMRRVLELTESMLTLAKSPNEGWKSIEINERCMLHVRTNQTIMEMKSQGVIDCKFTEFLTLVYLIKLYNACVPFCKESVDLLQPTRLEKIGFLRISIPIPFISDRSTFIRGIGIDRLEKNGTACIFAEGINNSKEYLQRNKIDIEKRMKGKELLDVKHVVIEMRYLGPKEFSYSAYAMVDHHIPLLPENLVSFVAKEFAKYLFKNLLKQLRKFDGSIWAKEKEANFEENREFYEWLDMKEKDIVRYTFREQK